MATLQLDETLMATGLAARIAERIRLTGGDWLDIGVGSGRLLEAGLASHGIDRYVGVELGSKLASAGLPSAAVAGELHIADVLQSDAMHSALGQRRFRVAVGNPPSGLGVVSPAAQARLRALYPEVVPIRSRTRLDLYVLLEALARLERPAEMAFVVAAPLVQDPTVAAFRKMLVESASEIECYELPDAFSQKGKVRAFLLVARFGQTQGARVTLGRLEGDDLALSAWRSLGASNAIRRMDLAYYEFQDMTQALTRRPGFATLADLGAHVAPGSRTKNQFVAMGVSHFHTSDFPVADGAVVFDEQWLRGVEMAQEGHTLVPCVGARCIERVVHVARGCCPITDAVCCVNVQARWRNDVFDWMYGEEGKAWRRTAAEVLGAGRLTAATLMTMPIPT
ncbi:hypothetical protein [Roseateles puraquae]|uniref:Uncharacterized protein n=1 Tax=Roseateles puraquae TaxID=431059 RepID=A0A254NP61_9BURK|nr:hypothetical protein [Roseateles puraquae]MDG0853707.1 hypothetical protein [Roseateles puraquae]OWR06163.1 hypothetical protein CDO81_07020 [Roseateles puraquae]